MENKSSRHHYIPQFLIKQFADEKGFLCVYDKVEERFLENRSPKSIFFEWNRNTLEINGETSDNFEKLYADLDSLSSPALSRIVTTHTITEEDLMAMILLATTLKWRVPANDEKFNDLKNSMTYKDLPVKLRHQGKEFETDSEIYKEITSKEPFKSMMRVIFSTLPFYKGDKIDEDKLLDLAYNSFVHSSHEEVISLLGDYPFIEKRNDNVHVLESFIFPLSTRETLIYKNGTTKSIKNQGFYILRDIATMHLANRFVACKSKEHLEFIIPLYKQGVREKHLDLVIEHVFDFV
jgi:hypothetical protein